MAMTPDDQKALEELRTADMIIPPELAEFLDSLISAAEVARRIERLDELYQKAGLSDFYLSMPGEESVLLDVDETVELRPALVTMIRIEVQNLKESLDDWPVSEDAKKVFASYAKTLEDG